MFKTFSGSAPTSPATSLAGNTPTVGWVIINDGTNPLLFKLSGYTSDPFRIESGEMMRVPVPVASATIEGSGGASAYRAMSFGLASLYQEYARELPAKYTLTGGGAVEVDSTMLAISEGAVDDDTEVPTNAPMVGVQFAVDADDEKVWQADRKYDLSLAILVKTETTGTPSDEIDILKAPNPGGSYTTIVGGPGPLDGLDPGDLLPTPGLPLLTVEAGECLKVVTTGPDSAVRLSLFLTTAA